MCPFLHWVLILWRLSFWVPCRSWILVPYQMSSWQRFSPIVCVGCLLSLVTISFAVQKLFGLMQSHFFILSLRCWAFEFCLGSCPLYLGVPVYFLLLPGVISKFQALYEGLWFTLSWFWYRVKDKDLASLLHVHSQFSQQHLLKRLSFLHRGFWDPLLKISWLYMSVFMSGSSILIPWSSCLFLCQYMLFLLLWPGSIVWSQLLWCLQHWTFYSELLCLFKIICVSICILGLIFLFLWRMLLEFQ
jgi:hypothetical protein